MTWEPMKIISLSPTSVWLLDKHGFQSEYPFNGVDFSQYKAGESIEVSILAEKLVAARKTGNLPLPSEQPGVHYQGDEQAAPPVVETITGDITRLNETGIVIDCYIRSRKNVTIPDEIAVGTYVEAVISENDLISIKKIPRPEKPPEQKSGYGKIIALELGSGTDAPHLEYEYSWTPQGEEKKTGIQKIDLFSETALEELKAFKVGDWVNVSLTKQHGKNTLQHIEKKVFPPKITGTIDPKTALSCALLGPATDLTLYCLKNNISDANKAEIWQSIKDMAGV